MKKNLIRLRDMAIGAILAFVSLFIVCIALQTGQAQPSGISTFLDPLFRTLTVWPGRTATNAVLFVGKYTTNWMKIEPTNCNIWVRPAGGTLIYTGITCQVNVTGTNNGNFTNMFFRNGLLVGQQ